MSVPQHHAEPCALDLVMEVTRRFLSRRTASSNGESDDALDAAPREYRGLDGNFFRLVVVHKSTDLSILALGILADE